MVNILLLLAISSDLSKNHLSGTIPHEFGQLTALEVLDLRNNKFTGTVPAELGSLQSLKRLYVYASKMFTHPKVFQPLLFTWIMSVSSSRLLCNNSFEGRIPSELGKRGLLIDVHCNERHAASAGFGCMNRKFGRW